MTSTMGIKGDNMWIIIFLPLAICILPIILYLTDPKNKKQHPPL